MEKAPWVGYALDTAQFLFILIGAWVGLILRSISREQKALETTMAAAIKERTEKFLALTARVDDHEAASMLLTDKIHICQLDHIQRAQRAELRSGDLARIEQQLTQLFELMRGVQKDQATLAAQVGEVMRYFHKRVNGVE